MDANYDMLCLLYKPRVKVLMIEIFVQKIEAHLPPHVAPYALVAHIVPGNDNAQELDGVLQQVTFGAAR